MGEVDTTSGATITWEETGSGRPVVLLGGLGMPPSVWSVCGLADRLAESGFRVVMPCPRGVLPSSTPSAPYSISQLAADVEAVLGAAGIDDDPILVGYSLGSYLAQELVLRSSRTFRGAVLVAGIDPSPLIGMVDRYQLEIIHRLGELPPAASVFELVVTSLPPSVLADRDALAQWAEVFGDDGYWGGIDGKVGQLAASKGWGDERDRHVDELARIDVPTLTIAFEHDLFFPPASEAEASARIPGARHLLVAEGAHAGLVTHPERAVAAIVDFCRTVPDRGVSSSG